MTKHERKNKLKRLQDGKTLDSHCMKPDGAYAALKAIEYTHLTKALLNTIETPTGCFEYQETLSNGYAVYNTIRLHKAVMELRGFNYDYTILNQRIETHHKCHNKACLNPEHLLVLTRLQHMERHDGEAIGLYGPELIDSSRSMRKTIKLLIPSDRFLS